MKRLYVAKDQFDEQVMMTYADTFTDLNLEHFSKSHKNSDNEATIIVAPFKSPFGLVEYNKSNMVNKFQGKPIFNYYIGYAIINQAAFKMIS